MNVYYKKLEGKVPSWDEFSALFEDEAGYPAAIYRAQESVSKSAILFNIVMDLKPRKAVVKLGRSCAVEEVVEIGRASCRERVWR